MMNADKSGTEAITGGHDGACFIEFLQVSPRGDCECVYSVHMEDFKERTIPEWLRELPKEIESKGQLQLLVPTTSGKFVPGRVGRPVNGKVCFVLLFLTLCE